MQRRPKLVLVIVVGHCGTAHGEQCTDVLVLDVLVSGVLVLGVLVLGVLVLGALVLGVLVSGILVSGASGTASYTSTHHEYILAHITSVYYHIPECILSYP